MDELATDGALKTMMRGIVKFNLLFEDNLGIHANLTELMKKTALKKYGHRFGWRWLSRVEKQKMFLDSIFAKGNKELGFSR